MDCEATGDQSSKGWAGQMTYKQKETALIVTAVIALVTLVGAFAYDLVTTGPKFTCVNGNLHMRLTTTKNIYQPMNQACVVATPK
jgi:hypothetical protein